MILFSIPKADSVWAVNELVQLVERNPLVRFVPLATRHHSSEITSVIRLQISVWPGRGQVAFRLGRADSLYRSLLLSRHNYSFAQVTYESE